MSKRGNTTARKLKNKGTTHARLALLTAGEQQVHEALKSLRRSGTLEQGLPKLQLIKEEIEKLGLGCPSIPTVSRSFIGLERKGKIRRRLELVA